MSEAANSEVEISSSDENVIYKICKNIIPTISEVKLDKQSKLLVKMNCDRSKYLKKAKAFSEKLKAHVSEDLFNRFRHREFFYVKKGKFQASGQDDLQFEDQSEIPDLMDNTCKLAKVSPESKTSAFELKNTAVEQKDPQSEEQIKPPLIDVLCRKAQLLSAIKNCTSDLNNAISEQKNTKIECKIAEIENKTAVTSIPELKNAVSEQENLQIEYKIAEIRNETAEKTTEICISEQKNAVLEQENPHTGYMIPKIENKIVEMITETSDSELRNTEAVEQSKPTNLNDINSKQLTSEIDISASEVESNSESSSKVIVQRLPNIGCYDISALRNTFSGLTHTHSNVSKLQAKQNSDIDSPWEDEIYEDEDNMSDGSTVNTDEEKILAPSCVKQSPNMHNKIESTSHGTFESSLYASVNDSPIAKKDSKRSWNGNFNIHPGNGMKLYEIDSVDTKLEDVSATVVRMLHFAMYGLHGLINNDNRSLTEQNILEFSGFNFSPESEVYKKRAESMARLPYNMLAAFYNILIGDAPRSKQDYVDDLLKFFLKPTGPPKEEICESDVPTTIADDIDPLVKKALEGKPVVQIKKLNETDIEKLTSRCADKVESGKVFKTLNTNTSFLNKNKAIQRKQSCVSFKKEVKLMDFAQIVLNVQNANEREIGILHKLLYDIVRCDTKSKHDILEFKGLLTDVSVGRVSKQLKSMDDYDLNLLCDIFTLKAKSVIKVKKIARLLSFIRRPHLFVKKKKNVFHLKRPTSNLSSVALAKRKRSLGLKKGKYLPNSLNVKDVSNSSSTDSPSITIRDFDNARRSIECASPEDLSALYDLMFVTTRGVRKKICDDNDIHERILNFSAFKFKPDSDDYDCRMTLLKYYSYKSLQNIASLLDIEDWRNCSNHQSLSSLILKFLMHMKLPVSQRKRPAEIVKLNKAKKSFPDSFSRNKELSESRSYSPDLFDSNYGSEEHNDNDWFCSVNYDRSPLSRYRQERNNGLSHRQQQILNDSTPLLDFREHPSDEVLISDINRIIDEYTINITMRDLVKKVLNFYPQFNLHYKVEFIKTKAIEKVRETYQNISIF